MTDKKLMELLVVIDDHYGRARSLEERRADTQIYIRAFGTIPDEIVEKALYTAFTQCRICTTRPTVDSLPPMGAS